MKCYIIELSNIYFLSFVNISFFFITFVIMITYKSDQIINHVPAWALVFLANIFIYLLSLLFQKLIYKFMKNNINNEYYEKIKKPILLFIVIICIIITNLTCKEKEIRNLIHALMGLSFLLNNLFDVLCSVIKLLAIEINLLSDESINNYVYYSSTISTDGCE